MKKQILLLILIIVFASLIIKISVDKNEGLADFSGINAVSQKDSVVSAANVSFLSSNPLTFLSSTLTPTSTEENFGAIETAEAVPERFHSCAVSISAKAGLAKYLDNNQNTFELNEKIVLPIASVSKLMAALAIAEKIGGNQEIRLSEKAINTQGIAGEFAVTELFRSKDLVKAGLMVSSNDAITALAEFFGEKKFVAEMNQRAKTLKMFDTYFVEPTGLSRLNQSTAVDLSKLTSYLYYNYPEILEITTQKERKIFDLEKGNFKRLVNTNVFAGEPDFIGGKSGYLDEETGRNLISLFKRSDRVVLTVILGAQDAFEETKKLLTCF